ncbi:restriction endonuclease subunit S [Clostridium butanoliproducens]|uniref:restriction endonuclease subunit S n=1 Tax=Clostridium butanoliproducens TaxID=2991837 RepID=UPI0024BB461E|nr:restriction endonuclease subunit S [Clostridium butanoliproducens]
MLVKYKLCELGDIFTGNTPSKKNSEFYDSKDIMFIKPDDINNNITEIESSKEYISNKAEKKARIVPKDSLLITCIGSIGKIAINKKESAFNQQINSIVHNEKIISSKYLAYVFKVNKQRLEAISNAPVVPIINKTQFSEFEVYIHEKKEIQQKIVYILDKAQSLIDKRKTQIEALDELVKSRFIEMFGDPVLNTKNWDIKPVIDICDCMVPGRDKPKSFTGNIPWITIEDLNVNSITYKSKSGLGLTDDEIKEVKRKKVPKGSVLMSCVGNLGICSIAGEEMIINQQLHSFQCKDINSIFLMYYLGFRKDYMISQASSTTVLYMNKSVCNSIPVYLPPIELQNQFADFVKQVDKLKFEMEKSLKELEDNFNSLMQKAFNGELFN